MAYKIDYEYIIQFASDLVRMNLVKPFLSPDTIHEAEIGYCVS